MSNTAPLPPKKTEIRYCLYCGKALGTGGKRQYCNAACKQAAFRQREKERVK